MVETTFNEIADGVFAFGERRRIGEEVVFAPNSGLVVSQGEALVIDGRPDARSAADFARRIEQLGVRVTYTVLTHFHGTRWVHTPDAPLVTSRKCRTELIHRGAGEMAASRLRDHLDVDPERQAAESGPPDVRLAFKAALSIIVGRRLVDVIHFGRGHTSGDAVVWVQDAGAMFAGDLVEAGVTPFIGDGVGDDWITTLDHLKSYKPAVLVPGRGPTAGSGDEAVAVIAAQRSFVDDIWRLAPEMRGLELGPAATAHLGEVAPERLRAAPLWAARAPFAAGRLIDVAAGRTIPPVWTVERARRALGGGRRPGGAAVLENAP